MIPLLTARVPPAAERHVLDVLRSGYVGRKGPQVTAFEERLADLLRVNDPRRIVTTNSGTSALVIALRCANVAGGHVLTSPMSFVATATAIVQAGAQPVWVDVESQALQMSSEALSDTLNRMETLGLRPTAILPVAWAGFLPRMEDFTNRAEEYNLPVILDAAQALGAEYGGFGLHEVADYVVYSFAPTKHLTTGDGGALVCPDVVTADRARRLAWFGLDPMAGRPSDRDVPEAGFKAHMNNLAAALGCAGLEDIDGVLGTCRGNAEFYRAEFQDLHSGSTPVRYEPWIEGTTPAPYTFTLFTPWPEGLISALAAYGIEAGRPHHRNDVYSFAVGSGCLKLKALDNLHPQYVSIPVGWWVGAAERRQIADAVKVYTASREGVR